MHKLHRENRDLQQKHLSKILFIPKQGTIVSIVLPILRVANELGHAGDFTVGHNCNRKDGWMNDEWMNGWMDGWKILL